MARKLPRSHATPPVSSTSIRAEIFLHADNVGTIVWILPEGLSREFLALPPKVQNEREKVAARRLNHLILMILALLRYPENEHRFGNKLDHALSELADTMSELIEKPPKPQ